MDYKKLNFKVDEKKKKIWDLFFVKTLGTSKVDHEYSLDEIPEHESEGSSIWLDMDLMETVENEMKSNLKQLILMREKAKLFCYCDVYNDIHPQVVKELKRLRKRVTKAELARYLEICMIPDAEQVKVIEKNLQSTLKTIIQNRDTDLLLTCEQYYNEFLKNISKEWNYLKTVVPEDDIVKYAVMVQKPKKDQMIL